MISIARVKPSGGLSIYTFSGSKELILMQVTFQWVGGRVYFKNKPEPTSPTTINTIKTINKRV